MEKIGTAYLYDANTKKLQEIDKNKVIMLLEKGQGTFNSETLRERRKGKTLKQIFGNSTYEDIIKGCEFRQVKKNLFYYDMRNNSSIRLLITYLDKEKLEEILQIKGGKKYDRTYNGGGQYRWRKAGEVSKLKQNQNITLKVPVTLELTYRVTGGTESEPLYRDGYGTDNLLEFELTKINENEIKKVVENKVKELVKKSMTVDYKNVYIGGWQCIEIPSDIDVEPKGE